MKEAERLLTTGVRVHVDIKIGRQAAVFTWNVKA
jgi:hypothetical protein